MDKYLKYTDQKVLDSGWEHFAPVFQTVPYPSEPGMQRIINQVATQVPAAKTIKAADTIDRSAIDTLKARGFFNTISPPASATPH